MMERYTIAPASRRTLVGTAAMMATATHALSQISAGAPLPASAGASRYEQISPKQLSEAIMRCPVAYIPAGIVEWHGEQSACGLDALKAESLCWMAAELLGGVCFPHVWLGPDASTPFDPTKYPRGTVTIDKKLYDEFAEHLLTRIESMGFRVAVYLSGHYPGVIPAVAKRFNARGKMQVISISENLVVKGIPAGDHAATWETALLKVLRPGLVDLTRLPALPVGTKHAGEVIPPAWRFKQRAEYYGIYGSDPRVWANNHFGRRGTEAVLDGLAREVAKALGDPSYGQRRRDITWPTDSRQHPEVRYDYQLPYQWIRRYEQAPVVYIPLPTLADSIIKTTQRAVDHARKTGGMVFPPFSYGPNRADRQPNIPKDLYIRIVDEIVHDLADMGFRVIALMPASGLSPETKAALDGIAIAGGQARALVLDPSDNDLAPTSVQRAIRETIPHQPATRRLVGPWRLNGERTIRDLREGVTGSRDVQTYVHSFELSEAEADQSSLLDLGTVENQCQVVVNGSPPITDHWPPYRVLLTGLLKPGQNTLQVTVRHSPQPTLDKWYYRVAPPRLRGPVSLSLWKP